MSAPAPSHEAKAGLLYWAQRALEECDKASHDFAADPVHDLRVAIRRCRSMADGFLSVDPDPRWREMKRLGKPLFASLGELRDTQVMMEWIEKLSTPDDPIRHVLLDTLRKREEEQKTAAQHALHNFDRQHWLLLNSDLAIRSRQVPIEGPVFQLVALERLHQARALHRQALRNRSGVAYHQLRIGIKRFRYTVENFLPQRHERWSKDLRLLQDALGEVHDFDVLWDMVKSHTEIPGGDRQRWHGVIHDEREKRIRSYREKMVGPQSLWNLWGAELPHAGALDEAVIEKFRTWAKFLDPHPVHAGRTEKLCLLLHGELARRGALKDNQHDRLILQAAALLHEIGRIAQEQAHQKKSYRMIRKLAPPPGWTAEDMHSVALVARYHRGKLAAPESSVFAGFSAARLRELMPLAGILRFANALDLYAAPDDMVALDGGGTALLVQVSSIAANPSHAGERLAQAKYLLEAACAIPVLIQMIDAASRSATVVGDGSSD